MKHKNIRQGKRPEDVIRDKIVIMLRSKGWWVKTTHGNMYQSGFPDIYATHSRIGPRWIEVKLPGMKGSRFTEAQQECFPQMCANGAPIWILTGATEDEYQKLFKPYNWFVYCYGMK